jgi:hypothetical protein
LCDWADQPDGEYHEFRGNQDFALQWLRQFRSDYFAMNMLRTLCAQESMTRLSDDEVLGQVSRWLSSGRVKARRPVIRSTAGIGTSEPEPVRESSPAFPLEDHKSRDREKKNRSLLVPKKTWVEIKLVDQDGAVVPNERYRVTLPDGTVKEGRLDEKGWMRESGIDPGQCTITFPDIHHEEWQPG